MLLAWGRISSVEAQQIAMAGMNDGLKGQYPKLEAIAKAGTCGKYAQNTRRDILKRCNPNEGMHFAGHQIDLPISIMDHGKWTAILDWTQNAILSPLRVLETLYLHQKDLFAKLLEKAQWFWRNVHPEDPKLVDHQITEVPSWKNKAFPIILWGDGAEFSKKNTTNVTILAW